MAPLGQPVTEGEVYTGYKMFGHAETISKIPLSVRRS